jgi:hypothetical protein
MGTGRKVETSPADDDNSQVSSGQGPMTDSCEKGCDLPGSTNDEELLDS